MKKKLLFILLIVASFGASAADYFYPAADSTWGYEYVVEEDGGSLYNPRTNKYASGIDDAFLNSQSDAYDDAFEFFVNVEDSVYTESGVVDTTNNTFTLSEQLIDSFYVSKSYYFSPNEPVVRTIYKIRNPFTETRSTKIGTFSNMGSDGSTQLDSCFTGGASLTDADRWMVTSDGSNGDPVLTWVRFGSGDISSSPIFGDKPEAGFDNYSDTIPVTVPGNSYVLIMQFNRMDSTVSAAKANVYKFNTLFTAIDAGYMEGVSNDDLGKIVNWSIVTGVGVNKPTISVLSVYPNPATDGISINVGKQTSPVSIFDLNGSLVLTQTVTEQANINISSLSKGVYVVKANGLVEKLVKE